LQSKTAVIPAFTAQNADLHVRIPAVATAVAAAWQTVAAKDISRRARQAPSQFSLRGLGRADEESGTNGL
jgi:hypothetical protein